MITVIVRKSSSLTPKRALATLSSIQSLLQQHPLPKPRNGVASRDFRPFSVLSTSKGCPFGIGGIIESKAREFHVKLGPSCYKASSVSQAEFAVENYSYEEEKGSNFNGSEEGLEISKLGISEEIVSALAGRGIIKLFPIQRAVLEPAMQGRDLFGRARTGTGKTLAFGIPVLDRILKYNAKHGCGRNPLALVMAPTRELARQVEKEFRESAPKLDTICVYGGTPIMRQIRELDYGVDVVVGTPGRIIDLMRRGSLNLSEIQFVILDEADQMLSVGFVDDIETIFQQLPKNRQSMLFSATMPSWIKNLIRNYLKDPLTIDLVGDADQKLPDGISIYSIASNMYERASILGPLITEHAKGGKCIIFTQTKRDADRLANAMARKFRCEALHGDISQSQRERTLSGFRNGNFNILIATDVAARGLDVPNVDLVLHYEIPNTSETFVHRSGRTGRAGKKGTAILIYTDDQARQVKLIEREVGCRFTQLPRIAIDGGDADMLGSMGNDRFSSGGMSNRRFGDTKYGRTGGFGNYGSGRPGGFRDYGSGRSGGFGKQGFGRSDGRDGHFSGHAGGFGNQGSGRSGYNQNQPGNYGGPSFGRTGDLGGSDRYNIFGDNGSGRPSRFGENYSDRSSGMSSDSRSGVFGNFGDSRKV